MRASKTCWATMALCAAVSGMSGCGSSAPEVNGAKPPGAVASVGLTAALADEPPIPALRWGELAPVVIDEPIAGRVLARQVVGASELMAIGFDLAGHGGDIQHLEARVVDAPRALAFVVPGTHPSGGWQSGQHTLWLRRAAPPSAEPLTVTLFSAARRAEPGQRITLKVAAAAPASDPALERAWAQAFAQHLDASGQGGAWHAFAAQRVLARHTGADPTAPPRPRTWRADPDLSLLMETMTGMSSIQEALQNDRELLIRTATAPRTLPLAQVERIPLANHPFAAMAKQLGEAPPAEPLAEATPAEFWYLRFASLPALFELTDQLDAWATPIANVLDGRAEKRALAQRYEAELGVGRGPLTRALGPEAIEAVALCGSDPYLREGSDVTVIFQVKSAMLVNAGLSAALSEHASGHGTVTSERLSHGGIDIRVARSADGAVRQHRATVGKLEIVSNSPAALRRVIDAAQGKRARLGAEPDFRYLLARDAAVPAEVLGFAGDRFVAEVIGPAQKIAKARRQIALAELSAPGYAALLHGWLEGRSPRSVDELVSAGLLAKDELRHRHDAEPIAWQPGRAARSSWGTPAALTPLIDRPLPDKVSEVERDAYRAFAAGYQRNWSTYVDPAMLRLDLGTRRKTGSDVSAHLRVLPLIDASEYRSIERDVGAARVSVPPLASGARAVIGVGREAELRDMLREMLSADLPGGRDLTIDWLGDWAMVGVLDSSRLALSTAALDDRLPQLPGPESGSRDDLSLLADLPLYAAVDVRSSAGAGVALLGLRGMAEQVLPGRVQWGESGRHREVAMVRVAVRERGETVSLHYALPDGALVVALSEPALRGAIDAQLDGTGPKAQGTDQRHGQLIVELAASERGGLWTVLAWELEALALESTRASRADAEALLRGAPELADDEAKLQALALAVFGAAPLTADGGAYTLTAAGVTDPLRGSEHAPRFPPLPVAGSPVAKLLATVASFRSELSFDSEGKGEAGAPLQSLRVRVALGLR